MRGAELGTAAPLSTSGAVAAEAGAAAAPAPSPSLSYMPALDGVRALSVAAVMLYHADVPLLRGGFFGVDVFFVLSGYLITSLLIAEHRRHGRIAYAAFWVRRARRLLPALTATLLLVGLYGVLFADPVQTARLRGDALAAALYVSNFWQLASGQSYFERFADPSPLRHMWSLSIEGQFYLLWPPLFAAALRVAGGRLRPLAWSAAALGVASAAWMASLYVPGEDWSRLYYGTDTRSQVLWFGAALACVLEGRAVRAAGTVWPGLLAVMGALLCGALFVFADDSAGFIYRGGFVLISLGAAAIITGCVLQPSSAAPRVLSLPALVYVGKISYGLYLYHWPVYVLCSPARTGLEGATLLALRLALSLALAAGSYHALELPARRGWLRPPARLLSSVGVGLALSALLLLFGLREPSRAARTAVRGSGPVRVLVIGDSVAHTLAEGFPHERIRRFTVHGRGFPGCGVMTGTELLRGLPPKQACPGWEEAWRRSIWQTRPHVVLVLIGSWEQVPRIVDGTRYEPGTAPWRRYFVGQLDRAVAIVGSMGARVVFLAPPCSRPPGSEGCGEPGYRPVLETIVEYAREHEPIALLDLASFVAPNMTYRSELNGVVLHTDGVHYTAAGAALVWEWMTPQLERLIAEHRARAREQGGKHGRARARP